MAGNPRIDDLRKRLEKDPGSRLFAQLAEELRKDGDLEEAISVSREGLKRQPAYPSARMTLGRALFDTGDVAAARAEFETVLKGAPDNILASKLLAECLEGLGDLPAAVRQYKATLAMAPGDKQMQAHLGEVEKRMKSGPATAPTPAAAMPPPASAAPPTILMPPPAAPTVMMPAPALPARAFEPASDTSPDRYPEPEPEPEAPPEARTPDRDFAPIPVASVGEDETFELEAAHASPPTKVGGGTAGGPRADWVVGIAMPMPPPEFPMPEDSPTIAEPPPAATPEEEPAFELERPYEAAPAQGEDFAEEFVPPAPEPPRLPPLEPEPPPPFRRPAPPIEQPAWPMDATVMMQAPELPAPPAVPTGPPPAAPSEPRWSVPVPPYEPPAVTAGPRAEPAPPAPPVFEEQDTPAPAIFEEPAAPAPSVIEEPEAPPQPPVSAAEPAPPARAEPDLSSSTLAELYFNQGFTDKALAVYQQLLQREPGNERARARVAELEGLERQLRAEESRGPAADPAASQDPAAARRQAIERTIARLEGLLAAVKKGEA